jgi:hypothetical protein
MSSAFPSSKMIVTSLVLVAGADGLLRSTNQLTVRSSLVTCSTFLTTVVQVVFGFLSLLGNASAKTLSTSSSVIPTFNRSRQSMGFAARVVAGFVVGFLVGFDGVAAMDRQAASKATAIRFMQTLSYGGIAIITGMQFLSLRKRPLLKGFAAGKMAGKNYVLIGLGAIKNGGNSVSIPPASMSF